MKYFVHFTFFFGIILTYLLGRLALLHETQSEKRKNKLFLTISANVAHLSEYARTVDGKVLIEDSHETLVKEVATLSNLNFVPGEIKNFSNLTFNTSTTYAGDYRAHLILYEDQKQVGEDTADFTILSNKAMASKVTTDKISYNPNEEVTILSTVQSASPNYIFSNLSVRVEIINSQGTTLFPDSKTIPILTPSQLVELKTYWNTAINPKGIYTAILQVFEGQSILSISAASFEIIGSSQTSEGVLGTIKAAPNPVYQGWNETIIYTVKNSGNEDISNLNVEVLILNPDTREIKQTLETTANIPMGTTLTGNFNFSTMNLTPRTYLAILQVFLPTMAQPKSLASTTFEVIAGLEIIKTIPDMTNLLVWINDRCKENHSFPKQGAKCHEPGHKSCIRVDFLENILTEAGINYHILYNRHDFEDEIRNPLYTDFMVLGDHEPLTDHYGEELREQVYSGKGLFSSLYLKHGQFFEDDYEPLFGLTYRGHLPGFSHNINIPEGPLSEPISFEAEGRALRVEVDDPGRIMGWIEWPRSHKGHPSIKEYPAIVVNQYGGGKTVFFAFEIGSTLNDENYSALSMVLKNALSYIHSPIDTGAFSPYQFVPVMLTLKSLSGTFDLRIRKTYTEELKLYNPAAGEWITDNPWIFNIHLNADDIKTILFYTLTPDQPGAYLLQTDAEYIENGSYYPYRSLSLTILIEQSTAEMAQEILDSLSAIQVMRMSDKLAIKNAMMFIKKIQDRIGSSYFDAEKNILDILKAIESLILVKNIDISNIRLMMDELLKIWEAKVYFSPLQPPHHFRQHTD